MVGGGGGGGEVIGGRGEVVVVGRAEIDTRAPFRSVKEAVVLFGERILAGELSAGRRPLSVTEHTLSTAQNRVAATRPNHHAVSVVAGTVTAATPRAVPPVVVTAELEEARQKLEKEREDKQKMAGCIQTLQEELSHAMRELKRLKARDDEEAGAKVIDLEIDDGLHFIEDERQQQLAALPRGSADGIAAAGGELQKKRYVTFADPSTVATTCRAPPLPDVVMELHRAPPPQQPHQPQPHYYREPRFHRQMSAGNEAAKAMAEEGRKKKKKPLIPLVGALFMRRKKSSSSSCHDDMAF